ncbi:MAG TPA: DmsC/YnfH family molybdoenzyme membrane anchor subunit [Candidatus Angelobacter sp.]|nr:DmsC/YnfH family molybdoenzyme membrane anchor subunit [Candidatus Angelobacter sp.]
MITPAQSQGEARTLIDALLEEQRDLTAVERFARWHDENAGSDLPSASHRVLVPLTAPKPGEQYAFEVDLDRCSGCKSCVTACHALNGLDDDETWRSIGLLHGRGRNSFQQTITTACHHCVEPGCVDGCPVLAYDKDPLTGIVRHLDDQCMGCQYCIFMCPYEVPKYSEQRGIVRKCDMCHQRLAHGEAPACVQACPSEAIRITVVEKTSVRNSYREQANEFLPCSPEPAITLPTTRYVSAKPLAPNLTAGDAHEVRLQPAHAPLVWMLVLTQLGAGGFASLPFAARGAQPGLATIALIATLLGMGASILHLGRPEKAWRAFLGLRCSWLSREIVGFSFFALLAVATTVAVFFAKPLPALLLTTAIVGIFGVFSSGMTYHVTQRECWRGELSIGRFFGTTVILGAAAAWCANTFAGAGGAAFTLLLAIATMVKLSRELAFLRLCPDDADLEEDPPTGLQARTAFIMRFRLGWILRTRLTCAWLGGVVLPLLSFLPIAAPRTDAIAGLLLCFIGELIERFLFFRTVAVSKMPGSVHA